MARFATDAKGVALALRRMELAVRLSMLMVDTMESVFKVVSIGGNLNIFIFCVFV